MLCKKCKEQIEVGEAMRAEPASPGSQHHVFYHYGCYNAVKEERQKTSLEDQVNAARSVC